MDRSDSTFGQWIFEKEIETQSESKGACSLEDFLCQRNLDPSLARLTTGEGEDNQSYFLAEMAVNGLRDQDRLDGASNFVIWKARILEILYKHRIKDYALKLVVVLVDVDPL